ncbi:type II glyceraldehyde-3-phosphate dehydrogenase [Candidatus Woesearchaeota archaeon]|nr:type II glyceraldehyde-3-phosphate dehydrogenase [Candidatus Woesearchaeota archaeon]
MEKIKVGIMGFGTIGKRVADAVSKQEDMELVGVTGRSYNWRIRSAQEKGYDIYFVDDGAALRENGIKVKGKADDLLKKVDVMVDTAPKKIGAENKDKYYKPNNVKAIFQGGEKPHVADASFVAQCNYDECVGKDYLRVVSCNTTGLSRTLNEVNKKWGIKEIYATMIRRGADPWDIRHGPINAIVPVLELPSHHGPDVQTVLHDVQIFTTALSVSSSLMHVHTITCECREKPDVNKAISLFSRTRRVRVVANESSVRSTAEIMELAKDLGNSRGDMPEICIWKEAVGTHGNKLLYIQAVHQESDVVCENIDAIRATMGFKDGKKSMDMTDKSLGIDYCKDCTYNGD